MIDPKLSQDRLCEFKDNIPFVSLGSLKQRIIKIEVKLQRMDEYIEELKRAKAWVDSIPGECRVIE